MSQQELFFFICCSLFFAMDMNDVPLNMYLVFCVRATHFLAAIPFGNGSLIKSLIGGGMGILNDITRGYLFTMGLGELTMKMNSLSRCWLLSIRGDLLFGSVSKFTAGLIPLLTAVFPRIPTSALSYCTR